MSKGKKFAAATTLVAVLLVFGVLFVQRRQAEEQARRAEQARLVAAETEQDRAALGTAVKAFARISSGLEIGATYKEFGEQLKSAKLALEELEERKPLQLGPLKKTIEEHLRAALSDYVSSYGIWESKIDAAPNQLVYCSLDSPRWFYRAGSRGERTDAPANMGEILDRFQLSRVVYSLDQGSYFLWVASMDDAQQSLWSAAEEHVNAARKLLAAGSQAVPSATPVPVALSKAAPASGIAYKDDYNLGVRMGKDASREIYASNSGFQDADGWGREQLMKVVNALASVRDTEMTLQASGPRFAAGYKIGLQRGLQEQISAHHQAIARAAALQRAQEEAERRAEERRQREAHAAYMREMNALYRPAPQVITPKLPGQSYPTSSGSYSSYY